MRSLARYVATPWRFGWLLLWALSVHAVDEPMTVSLVGHEYPPLIGQNLPFGGLLTRIVSESFAATGAKVHVEFVPNNRAISGVMKGIYDGSYGWAHAADRDQKLLYSTNAIYTFRMVFFQRRGQEYPWQHLIDLRSVRIGATLGDHYSNEFSALEAAGTLHIDYANDDTSSMKKLILGRIDLLPMEETSGQFLINEIFGPADRGKLSSQDNTIAIVPTYLVMRRDYPKAKEVIERFDRGFSQLEKSGELRKIIDETLSTIFKSQLPAKEETHKP